MPKSTRPSPHSFRCSDETYKKLQDIRIKYGVSESEAICIAIDIATTGKQPVTVRPAHADVEKLRAALKVVEKFATELKLARTAKWLECFSAEEKRIHIAAAEARLAALIDVAQAEAAAIRVLLNANGVNHAVDVVALKESVAFIRAEVQRLAPDKSGPESFRQFALLSRLLSFLGLIGLGGHDDVEPKE